MKSIQVGHTTVHYLQTGRMKAPPLVFLQGFGIAPRFYKPLFEHLGRDFEIFAPDLLRARAAGGRPASVNGCASLVDGFCRAMGLSDYALAGHSMGGATASTLASNSDGPRCMVGINPVLPVDFGPAGFVTRSMIKSLREASGRSGGWRAVRFAGRFHGGFMRDIIGDVKGTASFLGEALRFDYADLSVSQPTLILFADEDEYFGLDSRAEAGLQGAFEALTIERLPGLNHDWPIFYPNRAARAIRGFAGEV